MPQKHSDALWLVQSKGLLPVPLMLSSRQVRIRTSALFAVLQVSYKEPTPPDTELIVRSHVVAVRENQNPGLGKAAVEVDVAILLPQPDGSEKLLVQVGGPVVLLWCVGHKDCVWSVGGGQLMVTGMCDWHC